METITLDTVSIEQPQPTHRRARIVVAAAGLAVIASVAGVALATRDDGAGTRAPDAGVDATVPATAVQDPLITRFGTPPAPDGWEGPTADRPFHGRF